MAERAYLVRLDHYDNGWLDNGWKLKFVCDDTAVFHSTVDRIKCLVPAFGRRWIKDEKCWWIADTYLADLAGLFSNFTDMRRNTSYGHSSYDTQHGSSTPSRVEAAFAALHLLPNAPPEVVKAAHRACAMLYHPDHQGDVERMKQVNLAYELAYQWSLQHRA